MLPIGRTTRAFAKKKKKTGFLPRRKLGAECEKWLGIIEKKKKKKREEKRKKEIMDVQQVDVSASSSFTLSDVKLALPF